MDLQSKIGLWADSKIASYYLESPPLWKQRDWLLSLLIPKCGHTDLDTKVKCQKTGEPCYLNAGEQEEEILWYCVGHMHQEGFCRGCRLFWAGAEDFEFGNGLCSNCHHQEPEYDESEFDQELSECGMTGDGFCTLAGTEHCDWDCHVFD